MNIEVQFSRAAYQILVLLLTQIATRVEVGLWILQQAHQILAIETQEEVVKQLLILRLDDFSHLFLQLKDRVHRLRVAESDVWQTCH